MLSAYSTYASSAYYASVRGDLRGMAHAVAYDLSYTDGRPGVLDAGKLNNASERGDMPVYGYPGSSVRVVVDAPGLEWYLGRASTGKSASYRIPVSVVLSDARCVPGTLTVTMWEG